MTTAACGRNREELLGPRSDFSKPCQGAAEKSANATRCCCLARGFQRVGMSTVEAVNRKISWLFFSIREAVFHQAATIGSVDNVAILQVVDAVALGADYLLAVGGIPV